MVVVEVFVGNRMVFEGDKEEAHNRGVLLGWSGCTALMQIDSKLFIFEYVNMLNEKRAKSKTTVEKNLY